MAKLSTFKYYNARVLVSQAMAQQAKTAEVRAVHLELADRYRSLAVQAARDICARRVVSSDAAQPTVQVVFVEARNLNELNRI